MIRKRIAYSRIYELSLRIVRFWNVTDSRKLKIFVPDSRVTLIEMWMCVCVYFYEKDE